VLCVLHHAAFTAHCAADLSCVTDRQTDSENISNNQHLMHLMQHKNATAGSEKCKKRIHFVEIFLHYVKTDCIIMAIR